jgi:hypothetical protein
VVDRAPDFQHHRAGLPVANPKPGGEIDMATVTVNASE